LSLIPKGPSALSVQSGQSDRSREQHSRDPIGCPLGWCAWSSIP